MTREHLIERLRENAQYAERKAKKAKRINTRLRAEGRAEAYYLALALVEQVKESADFR